MLPDRIPDDIVLPTDTISIQGLATLFKRSVRTLQRDFKKAGIYDAIGMRFGKEFTPEQQLVIFYLYYTPGKYFKAFYWLEHSGFIETLVKHYALDKIKEKRMVKK